jgi:hypothetical protein
MPWLMGWSVKLGGTATTTLAGVEVREEIGSETTTV